MVEEVKNMSLTCWQGASWKQIIIFPFRVEFFLEVLYEKYVFLKLLLKFQIFFSPLFSLPTYSNIFDALLFLHFYITMKIHFNFDRVRVTAV